MNYKLYSSMKRITTWFCVGILTVTFSVLALRLTVFSDMAAPPDSAKGGSSGEGGFQINSAIYFPDATSKGDIFVTNLFSENLIKVNIVLKDSGESILSTGFINPGSSQNSTKLTPAGQKLEEGVYQCVAEVTAHNATNYKAVLGSSEMDVEIYIGVKPDWMEQK